MNSTDIDKLVRWAIDSDLRKFSEDAYGVTGSAFDVASEGDYLRGKFRQMQSNFIMWISGLDRKNRERLSRNITLHETEEFNPNEIGIEATKIMMSQINKKGE